MRWNDAPERRFKLERGRLIAETLRLPAKSIFEVAVGDRRIFSRTGKLAVSADGSVSLASGDAHAIADDSTTELKPVEVPDWGRRGLAALAKTGRPTGIGAAWLGGEENLLLPTWDGAKQIVSLPSSMLVAKKTLTAQASLQALAPLIQTATLGEGAPEKLDPVTLAPLPMPEASRKKLLRAFVGGRIDRYRRFPSGGWEILTRAADGRETPLRLRNGRAGQVPREERFVW